jgi:outer membrane lipoprotein SlyB
MAKRYTISKYGETKQARARKLDNAGTLSGIGGSVALGAAYASSGSGKGLFATSAALNAAGSVAKIRSARISAKTAGVEGLIARSRGQSPTLGMRGLPSQQMINQGKRVMNNGATREGGPQQHAVAGGTIMQPVQVTRNGKTFMQNHKVKVV